VQRVVQPEIEVDVEERRDPAGRLQRLRRYQDQPGAEIDYVLVIAGQVFHLRAAERAPVTAHEEQYRGCAAEVARMHRVALFVDSREVRQHLPWPDCVRHRASAPLQPPGEAGGESRNSEDGGAEKHEDIHRLIAASSREQPQSLVEGTVAVNACMPARERGYCRSTPQA